LLIVIRGENSIIFIEREMIFICREIYPILDGSNPA